MAAMDTTEQANAAKLYYVAYWTALKARSVKGFKIPTWENLSQAEKDAIIAGLVAAEAFIVAAQS